MWVLTFTVNDYNQYGEYFLDCWNEKPTLTQLAIALKNVDNAKCILNDHTHSYGDWKLEEVIHNTELNIYFVVVKLKKVNDPVLYENIIATSIQEAEQLVSDKVKKGIYNNGMEFLWLKKQKIESMKSGKMLD